MPDARLLTVFFLPPFFLSALPPIYLPDCVIDTPSFPPQFCNMILSKIIAIKRLALVLPLMLMVVIQIIGQKVGIGTTAPVTTLNLIGAGTHPTIPGITSTGVFRIGVAANEGIDFGKMVDSTFAGWVQSGYNGFVPDPLSLQPKGGNVGIGTVNPVNRLSVTGNANITGNVGIGIITPSTRLHVNGSLRVVDGTQGVGKILTSDASGLASWQPPPPPPPTYYPAVSICCQSWMTKNLDVTTYRNGDPIPKVTNAGAWAALTTGAYCYYNNDSTTYAATYGKLYNWYAVNDTRGLAPEGWHIPTDFEWTTLGSCLGGLGAGGPMKEIGTTHWNSPNSAATNLSGFTGLPGGYRYIDGPFYNIGYTGGWWSSTDNNADNAWSQLLSHNNDYLSRTNIGKRVGYSVRCLKD